MKVSAFHHVCIQTEVYEDSLTFYTDLLGFEITKVNPGFNTRDYNTWLEMPHMRIELQTPKKGTEFKIWSSLNSGPVHLAFVVDDVKKMYEYVKSQGYTKFKVKNGKELYEPIQGTFIFKVHAPEGTEIEIRENPGLD